MADLSFITDRFFTGQKPDLINSGHCFVWAWYAALHGPDSAKLGTWCSPNFWHAFVKIGRLYYDAAHPRGVTHIRQMTALRKHRPATHEILILTPAQFRRKWDPGWEDKGSWDRLPPFRRRRVTA
jgi:hypothetical protein